MARMSRDEWDVLVNQARARDMIEIAQAYGAQLRKLSGEFVGACLVCGTGHDRFAINPRKNVFNCRGCGKGGRGPIDLEIFLGDCDFVEAIERLTNTTSLNGQCSSPAKGTATRREREQYDAKQHAKAIWLWRQREPVAGSPVETYLQARGYTSVIPPTIGYLPARGEYPHAMIGAFALPNEVEPGKLGTPVVVRSVHLTKLLPDGSDRIREDKGKIIIGRPLGLPIAVSCIGDELSLAISEGIEDALAYRAAGFAAWAAGSAPSIPALAERIPDYITTVIIEQHVDPDGKAQHAVARLQTLLQERQVREGERPIEVIIREAGE
jgi:putative DNA primase/helicase